MISDDSAKKIECMEDLVNEVDKVEDGDTFTKTFEHLGSGSPSPNKSDKIDDMKTPKSQDEVAATTND